MQMHESAGTRLDGNSKYVTALMECKYTTSSFATQATCRVCHRASVKGRSYVRATAGAPSHRPGFTWGRADRGNPRGFASPGFLEMGV